MSKNKLKPCPFCGETAGLFITHKEYWYDECMYEAFITCENCCITLASGEVYEACDEAEAAAIEAWNTRPLEETKPDTQNTEQILSK